MTLKDISWQIIIGYQPPRSHGLGDSCLGTLEFGIRHETVRGGRRDDSVVYGERDLIRIFLSEFVGVNFLFEKSAMCSSFNRDGSDALWNSVDRGH